jgi:dTDP-4-amino-4,6-dideoxygalactose transaminase
VFLAYKCREAITLILRQLQLPSGSYVAINGYTCFVVYAAVVAAGLKPYLLDISKDNLNFSANTLAEALKKERLLCAVIVQNTLGMSSPIEGIRELCLQQKLPLIEDLAHSAGLVYPSGKRAGTVGQAAAFSFSQDKIIDAVSGGAALLFQKKAFEPDYMPVSTWQRLQAYWYPLNTFIVRKTHHLGLGKIWLRLLKLTKLIPNQMAGNPEDIRMLPNHQAKQALQALQLLPETIAHRQKIAAIYQKTLPPAVQLPHQDGSVYIRFPLLVEDPRGLETYLKQYGMYLGRPWYDAVVAPGKYLARTDYQQGQCPDAEYIAEHMANLPTHININEAQAQALAEKVNQWLSQ